jgi:hypothetical protein
MGITIEIERKKAYEYIEAVSDVIELSVSSERLPGLVEYEIESGSSFGSTEGCCSGNEHSTDMSPLSMETISIYKKEETAVGEEYNFYKNLSYIFDNRGFSETNRCCNTFA